MESVTSLLKNAQKALKSQKIEYAKKCFLLILKIDPSHIVSCYSLGSIFLDQKETGKALEYFKKAADLCQDNPDILYQYANTLYKMARYNEAAEQFEKAFELDPNHVPSLNDYSVCMYILGKLEESEKAIRRVIEIDQSCLHPYVNLANVLKEKGLINQALDYYEKVLSSNPSFYLARSNKLLCLCYSDLERKYILEEHKKWEENVTSPLPRGHFKKHDFNKNKNPLRIGYISADFKTHSAAYYIEPILVNHNRNKFDIFCYSDVINPDIVTFRLKKLDLHWRDIQDKDPKDVAGIIKNDNLDFMIDLSGHTGKNRLQLFISRLAPVQITYMGYPNTTGLSTMDYRFTDSWADPEDQDIYYTEKLYRLPNGFLCYRPPDNAPGINETPALKNGYITFGSFNTSAKINQKTVYVWSQILKLIPASKLMIKNKQMNDKSVQNMYEKYFTDHNIDKERIILKEFSSSRKEHLECYNNIDISLDTFPYNGTATTCESLWMGVPVITLAGTSHAGRVGVSLLTVIGLKGMIVPDYENYISLAVFLSKNIDKVSQMRKNLRLTLINSPLCDGITFTKKLENAYKDIWYIKSGSI
ncbi:MAG: tetratricopeptide repeat protein [Chitinispirillia bacterium]